jgi:type 1 glutamine amidotransferase
MRNRSPLRAPGSLSLLLALVAPLNFGTVASGAPETSSNGGAVRALMVTGGGWHDYEMQKEILSEGISSRTSVEWTILFEGMEGSTQQRSSHKVSALQEPGWEKDYDVVLYNLCYSNVEAVGFIEGITRVHEAGLPAVVLHCAVHSFRGAEGDPWGKLLGIDSRRHEGHRPYTVENLAPEHPIMKGFPATWTTPKGELYIINHIREGVTPLAQAYGVETERHHLTVWTHVYGAGRIFGTTIGHHNETMAADEYLDLVTRGLLWAVGQLPEEEPASNEKAAGSETRRLVLVAGRPSHGRGAHEHNAGVRLLRNCLEHVPGVEAVAFFNGWPEDPAAFDGADGILLYMDGGGGHPAIEEGRLRKLKELMERGVGLALFHYAVEVPADRGGPEFKNWVGGHYETHYSVNPIWQADFDSLPDHPITRGVQPFSVRDEWYFNIRFRPEMRGITPILRARPSDSTREGPYVNPRGPYAHVVEAKGKTETLAWAVEREDGGRGFGFTGGHFHENWGNASFRKLALNALVWITGAEVPAEGVDCEVRMEELEQHLDE